MVDTKDIDKQITELEEQRKKLQEQKKTLRVQAKAGKKIFPALLRRIRGEGSKLSKKNISVKEKIEEIAKIVFMAGEEVDKLPEVVLKPGRKRAPRKGKSAASNVPVEGQEGKEQGETPAPLPDTPNPEGSPDAN